MYCEKCGSELNGTDRFCSNCGEKVDIVGENVNETGKDEYQQEINSQAKTKTQHSLFSVEEKVSFWKVLVFSVLTFGIYGIYSMYRFGKDVNTLCNGDGRKSSNYFVVMLLSIITCGVYGIYWHYLQGKRLYDVGEGYGVIIQDKGSSIVLWMTFGSILFGLGPLIALYKLFRSRNMIAKKYNAGIINTSLVNYDSKNKMGWMPLILCWMGFFLFMAEELGVFSILPIVSRIQTYDIRELGRDVDQFIGETENSEYVKKIGNELSYFEDDYVKQVKNGCPEAYPGITYGEVLGKYIPDSEWSSNVDEDNTVKVYFNGQYQSNGQDKSIFICFSVTEEEVIIQHLSDGRGLLSRPEDDDKLNQFVNKLFDAYKKK